MTKRTCFTLVLAVLAIIVGLTGCCCLKFCKDQIVIIQQPQSITVTQGGPATFTVLAAKGAPWTTNGLYYQWQVNTQVVIPGNNLHWTNVVNATNQTLTIPDVQLSKVGYYRVLVSGSAAETSDAASLAMAATSGGGLTVYGTPVAQNKTVGTCPGHYYAYVKYTNLPPAWGYAVEVSTSGCRATAQDTLSTTKVEYLGLLGDANCNANGTVPVPKPAGPPPPSTRYVFTVYFCRTTYPTGPYLITLDNLVP